MCVFFQLLHCFRAYPYLACISLPLPVLVFNPHSGLLPSHLTLFTVYFLLFTNISAFSMYLQRIYSCLILEMFTISSPFVLITSIGLSNLSFLSHPFLISCYRHPHQNLYKSCVFYLSSLRTVFTLSCSHSISVYFSMVSAIVILASSGEILI